MPKTLRAQAQIIQGVEIILDNKRAHAIVADQANETGPGFGATPLELCVMSHAGCYVAVCVFVAKKMRLPLKRCIVEVEAIKSEETNTITEEIINVTIDTDAPIDRIRRLHEITLKNCPVGIIFEKAGIKTTYNLTLEKKETKTENKIRE